MKCAPGLNVLATRCARIRPACDSGVGRRSARGRSFRGRYLRGIFRAHRARRPPHGTHRDRRQDGRARLAARRSRMTSPRSVQTRAGLQRPHRFPRPLGRRVSLLRRHLRRSESPTISLSRRDRFIEGDSVQFDLDTTFDRRTAYHSRPTRRQQLDALHFNDTDFTTDWDAPGNRWWRNADRLVGGDAIPLRVMRIPVARVGWASTSTASSPAGTKRISGRFRPNGRPGDISRLGVLEGIEGIHPVQSLELRPYLGASLLRNVPAPADVRRTAS